MKPTVTQVAQLTFNMKAKDDQSSQDQEASNSTEKSSHKSAQNSVKYDRMGKIEKKFSDLKEKIYYDKLQWLQKDLQRISSGSHEKFKEGVEDLELIRTQKLWRTKQWRDYQFKNIERMYEAESQQANDEYESDKKQLQSKMLSSVQSKMSQLEEEKNNLNINDRDEPSTRSARQRKRVKEKEPKDFRRKLQPSQINFTLQDSEIAEDIKCMNNFFPADPNFEKSRWLSMSLVGDS